MEPSRADRILAGWNSYSRQVPRPGLPRRRAAVTTALPASTIAGAALLVGVVVAAGLWFGLPPGVGQPGGQASASLVAPSASSIDPSPSPSAVEPSASPVGTWGPLAVFPPQDGTDLARAEGTLRITDTCVYLQQQGEIMLLTWPADRTRWSGESRTITFENFDGSVVTVGDGDHVVLAGSGDREAESGISGEEWLRGTYWVARPASSCSLDPRFAVGVVGT